MPRPENGAIHLNATTMCPVASMAEKVSISKTMPMRSLNGIACSYFKAIPHEVGDVSL
jgi:hypothetical protein